MLNTISRLQKSVCELGCGLLPFHAGGFPSESIFCSTSLGTVTLQATAGLLMNYTFPLQVLATLLWFGLNANL